MAAYRLDPLDERIVEVLQDDGRASLARIGASVGLSADAVRARLSRLTADGIVKVIGVVEPASLGLRCIATIGIDLRADVRKFSDRMRAFREVTFLAVTVGEFAILAELAVVDDSALVDFVYGTLAELDGFRHAEIWKHLGVAKWDTRFAKVADDGRPPYTGDPLDETDARLLRALAENPRAKFSELSESAAVPYSVARRRSQQLFASGIIDAATVVNRVSTAVDAIALLGIEVLGDARGVAAALATVDGIEILIRTSGRFQLLAEVAGTSPDQLVLLVDEQVAAVPGVGRIALYPYARVEVLPFPWRFRRTVQPVP